MIVKIVGDPTIYRVVSIKTDLNVFELEPDIPTVENFKNVKKKEKWYRQYMKKRGKYGMDQK